MLGSGRIGEPSSVRYLAVSLVSLGIREAEAKGKPESAKFVFIRETLEKCVRLSYYERVCGTVPESFVGVFLPLAAPTTNFKFGTPESTGGKQSMSLGSFNPLTYDK